MPASRSCRSWLAQRPTRTDAAGSQRDASWMPVLRPMLSINGGQLTSCSNADKGSTHVPAPTRVPRPAASPPAPADSRARAGSWSTRPGSGGRPISSGWNGRCRSCRAASSPGSPFPAGHDRRPGPRPCDRSPPEQPGHGLVRDGELAALLHSTSARTVLAIPAQWLHATGPRGFPLGVTRGLPLTA
jgi:hypothetical protein